MTTLHAMALEDHIEDYGMYPLSYILHREDREKNVTMPEGGFEYGDGGYNEDGPMLETGNITLTYTLKNGHTLTRSYYIWANLEEGKIVNEYESRWEQVWKEARYGYMDALDLSSITEMSIGSVTLRDEQITKELVQSLLDAIKADCDERTMNQNDAYHEGYFLVYNRYDEDYYKSSSLSITLWTDNNVYGTGAFVYVFPDSAHTLNWMREHGFLTEQVVEEDPIVLD